MSIGKKRYAYAKRALAWHREFGLSKLFRGIGTIGTTVRCEDSKGTFRAIARASRRGFANAVNGKRSNGAGLFLLCCGQESLPVDGHVVLLRCSRCAATIVNQAFHQRSHLLHDLRVIRIKVSGFAQVMSQIVQLRRLAVGRCRRLIAPAAPAGTFQSQPRCHLPMAAVS